MKLPRRKTSHKRTYFYLSVPVPVLICLNIAMEWEIQFSSMIFTPLWVHLNITKALSLYVSVSLFLSLSAERNRVWEIWLPIFNSQDCPAAPILLCPHCHKSLAIPKSKEEAAEHNSLVVLNLSSKPASFYMSSLTSHDSNHHLCSSFPHHLKLPGNQLLRIFSKQPPAVFLCLRLHNCLYL